MLTLAQWLSRTAALRYRGLVGLPLTSVRLISLLGDQPPLTLNELAELSGIDKSQLSRTVSDLVAKKIVSRRTSEQDSRAVQISLTAKGHSLVAKMEESAELRNEQLFEGMSAAQRKALLGTLDKITERARAMWTAEDDSAA